MPPKPTTPAEAADLRRRAEGRLREQTAKAAVGRTGADTPRLLHELQVHQMELEMQNQGLQCAQAEAEGEQEKYSDLYDFAPVGCLTLDREGTICEANLTGASLLGIERSRAAGLRTAWVQGRLAETLPCRKISGDPCPGHRWRT